MIELGRICVKIAGRDAGKRCVIVDILDDKFVIVDGETRRRKCNIIHLEPTKEILKIGKGANHSEVIKAFKKVDIDISERKPKPKTERPKRIRKVKVKEAAPKQAKKPKSEKKVEDKTKEEEALPKKEIKKE